MKICMLAESLPPAFGGAGRQALALAAELRRQGISIFFISTQAAPGSPRDDTVDGFPVYRVPFALNGKWIKFKKLVGYCVLFWRHGHQFDILHVHGPNYLTLPASFFAQTVLRKKVLQKLTLIDFDTPSGIKRGRYGTLVWSFYRRSDAFACMSHRLLSECQEHGLPSTRLHFIPNGVDLQKFRPPHSPQERDSLREKLQIPRECHCGIIIGAVEKRKGIDLLVEVAVRLHSCGQDIRFLIIGPDGSGLDKRIVDAAYVHSIKERILAKGLKDSVCLLGLRNNAEEYLRAADFFIFTSRSEGFGTALIEAMATGLPAVALNIPGVTTDIITHNQNGIIIEQEDPEAFAGVILKLLSEPAYARALGSSARTTVQAKFDFSVVSRQYAALYRQLLTDA